MMTWRTWVQSAGAQLAATQANWCPPGVEASPRAEALVLLCAVLSVDRAAFWLHEHEALSAEEVTRLDEALARRTEGTPLAYVTQTQGFWSLSLQVTPAVLIPRPDSELLVTVALHCWPEASPARVLDVGTGSGALALAIQSARPHWQVTGLDCSTEALAVAQANGVRLNLPVQWQISDWLSAWPAGQRVDLLISNPPYLAPDDPHLPWLGHEPRSALVAEQDGLADLFTLVDQASSVLVPGGWLLLEHGATQAEAVQARCHQAGLTSVQSWQDYGGQWRVTGGRCALG